MKLTGTQVKKWALSKGYQGRAKLDELAEELGCSTTKVYSLFLRAEIDRNTTLSLAQIGCEPAQAVLRQSKNAS